jgi:quercetin dioxygenase-like cupin family protein
VVGAVQRRVTGEETQGRLFQLHVTDERGAATPLHVHRDADESFYVIDGELTFFVGDERIEGGAGCFALAPKGVPHAFFVRSERAEFLISYAPAGMEGFFAGVGIPVVPGEAKPDPMASDPEELARKAAAYEVEIVGPPPTL